MRPWLCIANCGATITQRLGDSDVEHFGEEHPGFAVAQSRLGTWLTKQGRYAEAEALLIKAHTVLEDQLDPKSIYTRRALGRIIALYEAWDKPDKPAEYRARQTQN